jgi:hypothetical protein
MPAIAKIKGTALCPGVSKNRRRYDHPMIVQAVADAQPAIAAGTMLMRAGHYAGDVDGIAGRVTALKVEADGSATFEAEIADTSAGRNVAALATDPLPYVGVSIAGEWTGEVRYEQQADGQMIETAQGLTLHGLDFVGSPGVAGARIVPESWQRPGRLFESTSAALVEGAEIDYSRLSSANLRRAAAAAYLAPGAVEATGQALESASEGQRMAAEIRAGHAALLARQWAARDSA